MLAPVTPTWVASAVGEAEIRLFLEGIVDLGRERNRLRRLLEGLEGELDRSEVKLKNADFLSKAPSQEVEKIQKRREQAQMRKSRLQKHLDRLGP